MRSVLTPLILTLLAGAALAGCIGDDDAPKSGEGEDLADEAKATDGAGSITGQVVANDLDVIGGAAVGLSQGGTIVSDTTTDKQGRYTLNGVEPGKYRIQVSSVCCKLGMKDVEVKAGAVSEANFQLPRLTPDDLQVPYMSENEWKGFISCGVSTPAAAAAACAFFEGTAVEDPNEDFLLEFPVNQYIQELVVVMDWEPVGGLSGGEFNLLVENDGCGFNSCSYQYADLAGPPTLRADIDDASISDPEWKWPKIEDNRTLQFRVFASGMVTLIYQQPFTVYYTAFYHQEAPEGYDPLPDA